MRGIGRGAMVDGVVYVKEVASTGWAECDVCCLGRRDFTQLIADPTYQGLMACGFLISVNCIESLNRPLIQIFYIANFY